METLLKVDAVQDFLDRNYVPSELQDIILELNKREFYIAQFLRAMHRVHEFYLSDKSAYIFEPREMEWDNFIWAFNEYSAELIQWIFVFERKPQWLLYFYRLCGKVIFKRG